MEKTVSEAIAYRRSVRVYKDEPIDTEKVKQCLINASLAPVRASVPKDHSCGNNYDQFLN